MKTRTIQQVDQDLKKLRSQVLDCIRDSDRWNITWERINKLLEERARLVEDKPPD